MINIHQLQGTKADIKWVLDKAADCNILHVQKQRVMRQIQEDWPALCDEDSLRLSIARSECADVPQSAIEMQTIGKAIFRCQTGGILQYTDLHVAGVGLLVKDSVPGSCQRTWPCWI